MKNEDFIPVLGLFIMIILGFTGTFLVYKNNNILGLMLIIWGLIINQLSISIYEKITKDKLK